MYFSCAFYRGLSYVNETHDPQRNLKVTASLLARTLFITASDGTTIVRPFSFLICCWHHRKKKRPKKCCIQSDKKKCSRRCQNSDDLSSLRYRRHPRHRRLPHSHRHQTQGFGGEDEDSGGVSGRKKKRVCSFYT